MEQILLVKLSTILIIIAIGYVGARRGYFSKEFTKTASSLTMNVMLTALVLDSVFNGLPDISGAELARLLLISTVSMVIMYIVGFLFALPFRKNKSRASIIEPLIAAPNTMFIAAPIVRELYGGTAMFYLIITCIPFNVLLYTYGVWRVGHGGNVKLSMRDIITLPLIASFAALIVAVFRIKAPELICDLCSVVGAATVPMSMIVIGASLGAVRIRDAFANPLTYFASFVRLIVCPIVIWLALRPFVTDTVLLNTMIMNAAVPSAVVIAVLAIQYDRDPELAAEGVLASVLLSVVTIPLISRLLL